MNALVVYNDEDLEAERVWNLKADHFYCIFDKPNLYQEDKDTHFFIGEKNKMNEFTSSLTSKGVDKIYLVANENCKIELDKALNHLGTQIVKIEK